VRGVALNVKHGVIHNVGKQVKAGLYGVFFRPMTALELQGIAIMLGIGLVGLILVVALIPDGWLRGVMAGVVICSGAWTSSAWEQRRLRPNEFERSDNAGDRQQ